MRLITLSIALVLSNIALAAGPGRVIGGPAHIQGCSAHEAIESLLKREGMEHFTIGTVIFQSATMSVDKATAEITYRNVEPTQRETFLLRRESLGGIQCFYAERPYAKESTTPTAPATTHETSGSYGSDSSSGSSGMQ